MKVFRLRIKAPMLLKPQTLIPLSPVRRLQTLNQDYSLNLNINCVSTALPALDPMLVTLRLKGRVCAADASGFQHGFGVRNFPRRWPRWGFAVLPGRWWPRPAAFMSEESFEILGVA